MKRYCFTLIELLVVIAILVILSSLMLPSLRSVISLSRATVCTANMKSVSYALFAYTNDCDGRLPRCVFTDPTKWFTAVLAPYMDCPKTGSSYTVVSATQYFSCPSEEYNFLTDSSSATYIGTTPIVSSYMGTVCFDNEASADINKSGGRCGGWQVCCNSTKFKRINTVIANSALMVEVAVVSCAIMGGDTVSGFYPHTWPRPYETNATNRLPNAAAPWRHNLKSNFLFVDGHVTSYGYGKLFDIHFRPE